MILLLAVCAPLFPSLRTDISTGIALSRLSLNAVIVVVLLRRIDAGVFNLVSRLVLLASDNAFFNDLFFVVPNRGPKLGLCTLVKT